MQTPGKKGLAPASLATLDDSGTALGATVPLRIARAVEIRLGPFRLRLHAQGSALERFVIARILPRSPAEDAGLKAGDEILARDRKPARSYSLDQIGQCFGKPGALTTFA